MRGLKLIHRAAEELRKHSGELTEEMMIDQFGSANTSRNSLVSSDTTVSIPSRCLVRTLTS
jgi:hypothetical protein